MTELTKIDIERICEQQLFHLPYFRGMLRAVEQSFYEQQEIEEPIYDLGAGDGHFAWALFKNQKVIGVDPWWQPLIEAKEKFTCSSYKQKVLVLLLRVEVVAQPSAILCWSIS